jgi:hypothetical protein
MMWYPDCQVPDEYSAVKIPPRLSSRKPGVFAPGSAEPTFQDMTLCERVWAPSGLAGEDVGLDKFNDDVQMPPTRPAGAGMEECAKKNFLNIVLLQILARILLFKAGASARLT